MESQIDFLFEGDIRSKSEKGLRWMNLHSFGRIRDSSRRKILTWRKSWRSLWSAWWYSCVELAWVQPSAKDAGNLVCANFCAVKAL